MYDLANICNIHSIFQLELKTQMNKAKKRQKQKNSAHCSVNVLSKLWSGGDEQFVLRIGPVVSVALSCVLNESEQW